MRASSNRPASALSWIFPPRNGICATRSTSRVVAVDRHGRGHGRDRRNAAGRGRNGRATSGREAHDRGASVDGTGSIIGGIFNTFPYVSYSQNIGLVGVTGAKSRWVCVMAGAILIVLGLIPTLAPAFYNQMPPPWTRSPIAGSSWPRRSSHHRLHPMWTSRERS
ncbi:solute carrier family 23 protein [Paracoccus aminovorans]|uniref:solute carrier family 23 protein n=1 Tax=Paracoccus aminovorans TaxID=34004 RepID=UPI001C12A7B7